MRQRGLSDRDARRLQMFGFANQMIEKIPVEGLTGTDRGIGRRQNRPYVMAFDVEKIRADFPVLSCEVYGRPLAYLDSRGDGPEAARGDRQGRLAASPDECQRAPGTALHERDLHRRVRGRT